VRNRLLGAAVSRERITSQRDKVISFTVLRGACAVALAFAVAVAVAGDDDDDEGGRAMENDYTR